MARRAGTLDGEGAGARALVGRSLRFFGGVDRPPPYDVDIDRSEHWALDLAVPAAGWEERAPLPNPRNHLGGANLGGALYAIDGQHPRNEAGGNQADVHRYDAATDGWVAVAPFPPAAATSSPPSPRTTVVWSSWAGRVATARSGV